jgi:hypothetical protein
MLAAAVGPIYLRAVDQTVLAERLQAAPQMRATSTSSGGR